MAVNAETNAAAEIRCVLEGGVLTGQRSLQSTSMVMGIREYRPGDAMNRIHWPSSVRHRGLQVKEFELDKTADLWIYLDLAGKRVQIGRAHV